MAIITGTTQFLGVIGDPIEHSLSPVMHNAALAELSQKKQDPGLSYVYLPLRISAQHLGVAVSGLAALGCCGFNVTIPHKQAIMPFLDQISAIATTVGAVNTVWQTEQGWAGTNTDVQGFVAPLLTQDQEWVGSTVTILGSGGAARAVIAGCLQLGVSTINLVGRSLAKLQSLQNDFGNRATAQLKIYAWDSIVEVLPWTQLLVNTTPVGMYPNIQASPLGADVLAFLPDTATVYDLIYTPNPTMLLQHAQSQGKRTIHGLEMLVQQGAAALEIWLGQPVSARLMRQAAEQQLFS